ncbi:mucin-7-like [Pantherophis guttatus]|uniref:Mucin-7-like n=1 Tax=Pantherophis guttatus TaxID=94885 RepID=A0ABM3ZLD8_PANGU|nr:mucin-7-like [Pantherophis guttatus]
MKPQLYSIVILLLTRINYAQTADNSTQGAAASTTQQAPLPIDNTTSVAKPPDNNVTSPTQAPGDHKTTAPETTEDVTSVTNAPKGTTTSVTEPPRETIVSEIPTNNVTVLSEAPSSQATSAPSSLAPNVSPVRTTKGFSGDTPRVTESTSVSIRNQTSKPIVAGNATTRRSSKVTNAVRKTTRLTSAKSTTGNRSSAFPVPSLFAIVLLGVSILCF